MSEAAFIQHFRDVPTQSARDCKLLVAARPDEEVVGYWGGHNKSNDIPNILMFNSAIMPLANGDSQWIAVLGTRRDATPATQPEPYLIEDGQPLTCVKATSYPSLEEEWGVVGPDGYSEWLAKAALERRESVINAVREYDDFYRANYPYSATDRDVYAVVGGWGLYVYENEWADHPESENIAFTLADAEPYYSVRRRSDGELILKTIIT